MWKRDQQQKATADVKQAPIQPAAPPAPPVPSPPAATPLSSHGSGVETPAPAPGASLWVKGEITAGEDLVLHGRVEGKVSLPGHMLTVGPQAEVSAEIAARSLIIHGSVTGNVAATERFELRTGGRMNGNVVCPSVVMTEGSEFTGGVDMRRRFGTTEGAPADGERRGKPSTA